MVVDVDGGAVGVEGGVFALQGPDYVGDRRAVGAGQVRVEVEIGGGEIGAVVQQDGADQLGWAARNVVVEGERDGDRVTDGGPVVDDVAPASDVALGEGAVDHRMARRGQDGHGDFSVR